MKLSDKILIGFFGLVFVYLISALTEVRFRGIPNLREGEGIAEHATLPSFSYLIVPELDRGITVSGSSEPGISVRSINGDMIDRVSYIQTGDTLQITGFTVAGNEQMQVTVFVPHHTFARLISNGGGIRIEALTLKKLSITQKAGWIRIADDVKLEELTLQVSELGNANYSGSQLHVATVTADNANVTIAQDVDRLKGVLSNDAYLRMHRVKEVNLKKDATCQFNMN